MAPNRPRPSALPAEMLPASVTRCGASSSNWPLPDKANAIVAKGQSISLARKIQPRICDLSPRFRLMRRSGGDLPPWRPRLRPQHPGIGGGYIGQWDNRTWKSKTSELPAFPGAADQRPRTRVEPFGELTGITPGSALNAPTSAWFAPRIITTPMAPTRSIAYSYLFAYAIDAPAGASDAAASGNNDAKDPHSGRDGFRRKRARARILAQGALRHLA